MSEISQSVKDISKIVGKAIKAQPDGTFEVTGDPYEEALKLTGLKKDQLKAVSDFNADFVAGAAHAFGKESIDALKKDKKLESTNVTIGMLGRDRVAMEFKRSETYPGIPKEKGGEAVPKTKYGVIKTSVKTKVGSRQGQLAEVYKTINDLSMKAFG